MCGIAGFLTPHPDQMPDLTVLKKMTDALRHRGPDGEGFYTRLGVALGHRRLAVIDPEGGDQPMFNEDGTVAIVFNGEIYNFELLRAALAAAGHVFRNRCDTEAIVHAWEEWGPACVERLSGMFAFALWDSRTRQFFCARDRLGKKPFHYAWVGGAFVFGSELGAMAAYPGMPQKLAPTAVEDFFTFGYVPEPETIFTGILKMPAAHYGLMGPGETELRPVRYWAPPDKVTPCTLEEAVPQLLAHLTRAVRERLVSDVPLGAFLSGGVDSSGVVAIAAGLRSTPLDTFTIGFDGGEDETPFARMVAQRYGTTQHTERAASVDMIDAARSQARIFGEPFGDSSSVPSLSVSRLARRHATVAISGDGGDEVFGGYRRYRWHGMVSAVRRFLPRSVRRGAVARLAAFYPKLDNAPRFLRAKTTLTELSLDSAVGYASTMTKTDAGKRHALFSPALRSAIAGHDPNAKLLAVMGAAEEADPLLAAQLADLATWLPGDILTKMDRTSMAASLESRAPLLDYEIFAWGLALPAALKIHGGEGKFVLKKALEKYLPSEILYRPKQGFASDLAPYFRREMSRIRLRLLGDIMLRHNLFDATAIGRLLDEHAAQAFDHAQTIWLLLCFEGFLYFLAGEPAA